MVLWCVRVEFQVRNNSNENNGIWKWIILFLRRPGLGIFQVYGDLHWFLQGPFRYYYLSEQRMREWNIYLEYCNKRGTLSLSKYLCNSWSVRELNKWVSHEEKRKTRTDASNWQNQVTPCNIAFKQANFKIKECSMKSPQQKKLKVQSNTWWIIF